MASSTVRRRGRGGARVGNAGHSASIRLRALVCVPVSVGWDVDRVPQMAGVGSWLKKKAKGGANLVGKGAGLAWKGQKAIAKWQYNQAKLGGKFLLERNLGMKPGSIDNALAAANKKGEPPDLPPQVMQFVQEVPKTWWEQLLEAIGLG